MTDSIYDWSITPDSNATADSSINWAENQQPDTVNNSARQMMGRVAEFLKDSSGLQASTGAANIYAVTTNSAPVALRDGFTVSFLAHQPNTTAAVIQVNSYGNKALRSRTATALLPNEILTGIPVVARYRLSTDEFLIDSSPNVWLQTLGPALFQSSTFGIKVGDVKLSLASSPDAGFLRLRETAQTITQTAYPDLYGWLSAQGFPWGGPGTLGSGNANIPPAGGYFLRFGSSGATVDPDGPRTAGLTQDDQNKAHTHAVSGTTNTTGAHTHTVANQGSTTATGIAYGVSNTSSGNTGSAGDHSHTVTGTAATDGGTEARPKNVTMYADMLAVPALVASGLVGASGLAYKLGSTTSSDPGLGNLAFNNGTVTSATSLVISETDANGAGLAAVLQAIPLGSYFYMTKLGAPANFIAGTFASIATDAGAYDTFTISGISSSGSISVGDAVSIVIMRQGLAGASGGGLLYVWDTGTSDANPGTGLVRANNASLASATAFYINTTDSNSANQTAWLDTWVAGSSSANKGTLHILKSSVPGVFAEYIVTAVTTASGYRKLSVSYLSGNGTFSSTDILSVSFSAKGDAGSISKYNTSIGDGSSLTYTVTHSLNTKDICISVYRNSDGLEVLADLSRTTLNAITVTFATAPSTNAYRVVVIG